MYEYVSQIGTTTQIAQDVGNDAVLTLVVVAGIVLAIALLSVGIAFVWRKVTKYALGRKF